MKRSEVVYLTNTMQRINIKQQIKRILYLLDRVSFLLPLFWLAALVVSMVEAYFYPGIIIKYTSFSPVIVYITFLLVGLFSLFNQKRRDSLVLYFFNKLSYIAMFLFGLMFAFFYLLDNATYTNYVFSTFHVHPKELATPFMLTIYMYFISLKEAPLVVFKKGKPLNRIKFPIMAVLLWMLIQNFIGSGAICIQNISFILKNPTASYDRKMEGKIGKKFYDYVLFVKSNTPENSIILTPPFPVYPWPQTGNVPYMRYFLYPRVLITGGQSDPLHDYKKENIDYVLIAWGEVENISPGYSHGWPKFNVKAEKIIYMVNGGDAEEVDEDYVYKNVENIELWGLIKVQK